MFKKNLLVGFILLFVCQTGLIAQFGNYSRNKIDSFKQFKPINLIDTPTANILTEYDEPNQNSQKYFHLSLRVYNLGGMIGGLTVGLTRHLMFGVSYGGQNVIGEGNVEWHPSPGIHFRYKIFSETYPFPPAIAIGFNSQGYGGYNTEKERYEIKSPGLYIVASKNIYNTNAILKLGFHGGLNYSTENKGGDKDLNIFGGIHLIIEDEISLVCEYDLATNDNDENSLGTGKGYMNGGIRWLFANRLILEFSAKNLLGNRKDENGQPINRSNRELKIIYRQHL